MADFQSKGATLPRIALEHSGPLALIELLNGGEAPSIVAGTENHALITRCNWNSDYPLTVTGLEQEVAGQIKPRA